MAAKHESITAEICQHSMFAMRVCVCVCARVGDRTLFYVISSLIDHPALASRM